MAEGSRLADKFWHDIPMYPGSQTSDGRIVGELHKGRKAADEFHEKSVALQKRALAQLTDLHGGKMEVPTEVFRALDTRAILTDMTHEMGNLYNAQQQTTGAVNDLRHVTSTGFHTLHSDLQGIKGPDAPHRSMAELIGNDDDLLVMLGAHEKGILNEEGQRQFFWQFINGKYAIPLEQRKEVEKHLESEMVKRGQDPKATTASFAMFLMTSPSELLEKGPQNSFFNDLIKLAHQYPNPVLDDFLARMKNLWSMYQHASKIAIPNPVLLRLGQNNLLHPQIQNMLMRSHPELRQADASVATMNYSLIDIARDSRTAVTQGKIQIGQGLIAMQQREIANHRLDTMIDSVAQVRAGIVDLTSVVEGVGACIEDGFHYLDARLEAGFDNVTYEIAETRAALEDGLSSIDSTIASGFIEIRDAMALTRAAVIAQMQALDDRLVSIRSEIQQMTRTMGIIGVEICFAINQSNRLLTHLGQLMEESHANEARQYFEEGRDCLKTAEIKDDIEDALKAFKKGVEAKTTSYENLYGVAFTSELLGKSEDAKSAYGKAARRGKEKNPGLASIAYENLGGIEQLQGNKQAALTNIREAVKLNPKNYSARYKEARHLVAEGFTDEAVNILLPLITENPAIYHQLKLDTSFPIVKPLLSRIRIQLWQQKIICDPRVLVSLLEDMMEADEEQLATEVFIYLVQINPRTLIKKKIWEHPKIMQIVIMLQPHLNEFLTQKLASLYYTTCYELTVLYYFMGFDADTLTHIVKAGISSDAAAYSENKTQTNMRLRAIMNSFAGRDISPLFEQLNI